MAINRGHYIRSLILEKGYKLNHIAEIIGYSKAHFYRILDEGNISWEKIYQIGRAIDHDFRQDFPEMPYTPAERADAEVSGNGSASVGKSDNLYELKKELQQMKDKYIKLLEEHMVLSKRMQDMIEKGSK
jgi:uncharacterized protein YdcH (DUF465 family)